MKFKVVQENFEGPLDLLLELIEKEGLDISQISLAGVTDDYIKHVKSLEKIDPEQLAEFLVIAAQLMLVKSRALLPSLPLAQDDQGSIEDLEKRLAEYKKIKELAKELKKLENKKRRIFSHEAYLNLDPVFYPPPKTTAGKIKDVFALFLSTIPKIEKLAEEKIKKIISIEEKINSIRSFLQGTAVKAFSEIVKNSKEKVEIIVSFLALLELSKQRFLDLEQNDLFADIVIKKK